ncbi:hypothetical protein TWF506_003702 [Arthrobotrys conoides]|uniref:Uncharacterized protein n=1 Tax=Arthrobotrys conoides TaxID=74498 RepID=A0AAN8RK25_9PEZI
MSPVTSKLSILFSKLTSQSKKQKSILSQEDELLLSTLFSPKLLKIFSHHHLLSFIPRVSSSLPLTESGDQDFGENDDKVIIQARRMGKEYEKMNGRVYDAGKLERCLVDVVGLRKEFVLGYVRWKRDGALGGMGFDGAEWNEEWVGEVGGVEGALGDILVNF